MIQQAIFWNKMDNSLLNNPKNLMV
jgi:hypothetical protein